MRFYLRSQIAVCDLIRFTLSFLLAWVFLRVRLYLRTLGNHGLYKMYIDHIESSFHRGHDRTLKSPLLFSLYFLIFWNFRVFLKKSFNFFFAYSVFFCFFQKEGITMFRSDLCPSAIIYSQNLL